VSSIATDLPRLFEPFYRGANATSWGGNGLGKLGPTVGWSLWNSILITTTVACGLATGEWRGVHGTPVRMLWASVVVLIVGMCILGAGV